MEERGIKRKRKREKEREREGNSSSGTFGESFWNKVVLSYKYPKSNCELIHFIGSRR